MRRLLIGRDIPGAGSMEREQLRGAATKSNEVLKQLGPDVQWVQSYVAGDKIFASIWRRTSHLCTSMQN